MKTVVFGLFEDTDSAQQVLTQLAKSPLDLDAVAVVHADPDVQRQMAVSAGLPERRSVIVGLLIGASLGGALGAWLGTDILNALGPLLAAAAGVLIGGALGAFFAALNESLRLPPEHAEALSKAVDAGATVVLVRSPSMPTARAIRDLFVAAGSVEMSAELPRSSEGGLVPVDDTAVADDEPHTTSIAEEPPTHPSGATEASTDEDSMFAPPWRRTPSSVRVPPGVTAVMDAEEQEEADQASSASKSALHDEADSPDHASPANDS